MELREFFSEDVIKLELEGTTKDEVLKELIALLGLDDKSEGMLFKMLKRRENLGSTGIGRGIAIPHCRSLVVNKLRVAFGRKSSGLDFKAIDEKPVNFFFLIVAPPLEVSNQYLPVLGKIAQFSKESDVPQRLLGLTEPVRIVDEVDAHEIRRIPFRTVLPCVDCSRFCSLSSSAGHCRPNPSSLSTYSVRAPACVSRCRTWSRAKRSSCRARRTHLS